jgi:hypothetical protein
MTTYKLELLPDSSHQWRLLELRPRKGTRGGLRYVCIAIGTGKTNMERLETELIDEATEANAVCSTAEA